MTCPHCGGRIIDREMRRQRRLIAQGRCPKCANGKLPSDGPYQLCANCRRRSSVARNKSYRAKHPTRRKFLKPKMSEAKLLKRFAVQMESAVER